MQHMYSTARGTCFMRMAVSAWHNPGGCRVAAHAQQHAERVGAVVSSRGACGSAFSDVTSFMSQGPCLIRPTNTSTCQLVVCFQLHRHTIMLGVIRH